MIFNNTDGPLNGTLGSIGQNIPVIGTHAGDRPGAGPADRRRPGDAARGRLDGVGPRTTRNVLADTRRPGRRPDRRRGRAPRLGRQGPGINDNGSGSPRSSRSPSSSPSAASTRTTGSASRGGAPRSTTSLGSTFYVNQLSDAELADILANLNFDMVGSPNYVRFVYDGDNSAFPAGRPRRTGPTAPARSSPCSCPTSANQGLASDPTPFSGRSDYGPFIAEGIPAGGLFTGAEGDQDRAQASGSTAAPPGWRTTRATTRPATRSPTTTTRAWTRCPTPRRTRRTPTR